ncbi:hypothetical protein MMC2321_05239 [Chitinophaga sp. MM2321]
MLFQAAIQPLKAIETPEGYLLLFQDLYGNEIILVQLALS